MLEAGFRPRNRLGTNKKGEDIYDWGTTRKGLTGSINEVIKELWPDGSVTRESLGILAKARAMLYFNGHVYPVSFDTKEELVRIGTTDMVIVEKEGVTDVLLEAAREVQSCISCNRWEICRLCQRPNETSSRSWYECLCSNRLRYR